MFPALRVQRSQWRRFTPSWSLREAATNDALAIIRAAMETRQPTSDRPRLPDGYGVPADNEGLLPWSWAVERLRNADNYWFSTTRPDGRPHAMPAWGAWLDGLLYFEGSPQTRRARNLALNPALTVHLESGTEVLILEGEAHDVVKPERALAERLAADFTAKYSGPALALPAGAHSVGQGRPLGPATARCFRLERFPQRHDSLALSGRLAVPLVAALAAFYAGP